MHHVSHIVHSARQLRTLMVAVCAASWFNFSSNTSWFRRRSWICMGAAVFSKSLSERKVAALSGRVTAENGPWAIKNAAAVLVARGKDTPSVALPETSHNSGPVSAGLACTPMMSCVRYPQQCMS